MSAHFAGDASQLPLDYLRGLAIISSGVAVDEGSRGESCPAEGATGEVVPVGNATNTPVLTYNPSPHSPPHS